MPSTAEPASDSRTPLRPHRAGLLASIALVVLALDLTSKIWAVAALSDREPLRLAGGALYLTLARNTGAAFSMGTNFTVVITCVMIAVIVGIVYVSRKVLSSAWAWALGLVLGGACGNLIDRLFREPGPFRGGVIDFFSVFDPYGGFFPIFNIADMCIVGGGIFAALLALTGRDLDGTRVGADKQTPAQPDVDAAEDAPGEKP